MLSTSSLNGKFEAIYIKDIINLVHNPETIWDDQTINNRIFQKISLYGDFELVKTMVLDSKFNLNLSEISVFFYEKISTKKYKKIFLFLLENHFMDNYINDLFVYLADKKLSLIRRFLPQIQSSFVIEQAIISCIFKDNLDNFVYIWENNVSDKTFTTHFIHICIREQAVKILNYFLSTLSQEKIQNLFNNFMYDTDNNNDNYTYFSVFTVFIKQNAKIPHLSPQYIDDLAENFRKIELFHYLLQHKHIEPSTEIFDTFINSDVYNMAKNFEEFGHMYISFEEKNMLDYIYNLLYKDYF